jgi:hypothetical protein
LLRLRSRRRRTEVDLRRLLDLGRVLDGEVGLGLVAEHHRREVDRELPDVGVVVLHRADVTLALDGDAVLGAFQLRLQLQEVLVGLELRIVLADHQQAPDRALQLALRLLELLQRGRIVGVDVDAADLGARLGDLGQYLLLVAGIPADGVDQIGHQVGTALVDVEHLRPGGGDGLVLLLDGVVAAAAEQGGQAEQPETSGKP